MSNDLANTVRNPRPNPTQIRDQSSQAVHMRVHFHVLFSKCHIIWFSDVIKFCSAESCRPENNDRLHLVLNQRRIVATSTCSLRQEPVNKIKTELVNFLENVSSLHLGRLTVHRTIAIFTCHATGSCGVTMNTPGFKIRSNYLWKMSCIMQKSTHCKSFCHVIETT